MPSADFSLSVVGACEVDFTHNIFLTRANKCIHKIIRHFDGTLNHFGSMIFVENLQQNESCTFIDMLLQTGNSVSFEPLLRRLNHINPEFTEQSWKIVKSKISTKINMGISRLFYLFDLSSAINPHCRISPC